MAEVENAVVVAGRIAEEHVFEHGLGDAGGAAVSDEEGPELAVAGAAEGHVVAKDLELLAVLFDVGEDVVGVGSFLGVGLLDVGELVASDDALLGLGGESVPALHVVEVFLNNDVAPAAEGGVLLADDGGVACGLAAGVFGAVDEAEDVAVVEVAEAVGLVGDGDVIAECVHDVGGELEAEVDAFGADVEEEVAGCGDGVATAGAELAEGMELGGAGLAEEAVPCVGAVADDTGQSGLDVAELDGSDKPGEVSREPAEMRVGGGVLLDADDEEDGRAGERTDNGLGEDDLVELAGCVHKVVCDLRRVACYRSIAFSACAVESGRLQGFLNCRASSIERWMRHSIFRSATNSMIPSSLLTIRKQEV